jgi:hypothetical protein
MLRFHWDSDPFDSSSGVQHMIRSFYRAVTIVRLLTCIQQPFCHGRHLASALQLAKLYSQWGFIVHVNTFYSFYCSGTNPSAMALASRVSTSAVAGRAQLHRPTHTRRAVVSAALRANGRGFSLAPLRKEISSTASSPSFICRVKSQSADLEIGMAAPAFQVRGCVLGQHDLASTLARTYPWGS